MAVSLQPETQKLIEDRMKQSGFSTPDDMVRVALETLDQCDVDDLDQITDYIKKDSPRNAARVLTVRHGHRRQPKRFR
jgi:hypothetical protein